MKMKASPQTNKGGGGFFNRSQPPGSAPARATRQEEKVELLDDDEEAPSQQVSAARQEEGGGSIAKKSSKERVELVEERGAPRTDSQVALQYGEMDEDIKNVIRARDGLPGMQPPVDAVPGEITDRERKGRKKGNAIPASSDASPAAASSPGGGDRASPSRPADRARPRPPSTTTTTTIPPRAPAAAHSRPSRAPPGENDRIANRRRRPDPPTPDDEQSATPLLEATLVSDDLSVYVATCVPDVVEQANEPSNELSDEDEQDGDSFPDEPLSDKPDSDKPDSDDPYDEPSYDREPTLPLWKRKKKCILAGLISLVIGGIAVAVALLVLIRSPTPPTSLPTPEPSSASATQYALSLSVESPRTNPPSRFGASVAVSADGGLVAAGATEAPGGPAGEEVAGAIYLYHLEKKTKSMVGTGQAIYGASPRSEFGNAVALSQDGRRMVVGARSENRQAGAMRVYQRDTEDNLIGSSPNVIRVAGGEYDALPSTWSLMEGGFLQGNSSEWAAWSVSISGDGNVVAMGSPKGGSHVGGSVLAFKYDGLSMRWKSYGSTAQGLMGEEVGFSISLSYRGSIMAVGFPKAANNAGKTAVYEWNGMKMEWQPLGQEVYGKANGDNGGTAVAISQDGSTVVIGSKGRNEVDASTGDVILESAGHCHVYQIQDSWWELQHSIVGEAREEQLGSSVAVSPDGNTVACGGVGGANGGMKRSGVVRVWNRMTLETSAIWPQGDTADVEEATFGASVAISADGEYIVVGAPTWDSANGGSASAGAIQIFFRTYPPLREEPSAAPIIQISTKRPSLTPRSVPADVPSAALSSFPSSSKVPSSIPSSCLPKTYTLETEFQLNNACEGPCLMYTALRGNTAVITEGIIVHFFEFMDGTWSEVTVVSVDTTPSTPALFPYISGDVVAVGAIYHTPINFVIIFERRDSKPFWRKTDQIFDPNDKKSPYNEFGSTVAIDGPWLVVGSRNDKGSKGSAYIYHRDASPGKYNQMQKIAPDYDDDTNGWFGSSVAIRDDTMVIGARRYGSGNKGAVFVYGYDEESGNWIESQDRIFNENCPKEFGFSVALGVDEELFVGCVGFYDRTFTGRAYHYVRLNDNVRAYIQTQKVVPASAIAVYDFFGSNVALDGNVMAIGAYGGGEVIGMVYIFARHSPNHNWTESFHIKNPMKKSEFGSGVELSGSTMLTLGNGKVYIYTIEC